MCVYVRYLQTWLWCLKICSVDFVEETFADTQYAQIDVESASGFISSKRKNACVNSYSNIAKIDTSTTPVNKMCLLRKTKVVCQEHHDNPVGKTSLEVILLRRNKSSATADHSRPW